MENAVGIFELCQGAVEFLLFVEVFIISINVDGFE